MSIYWSLKDNSRRAEGNQGGKKWIAGSLQQYSASPGSCVGKNTGYYALLIKYITRIIHK